MMSKWQSHRETQSHGRQLNKMNTIEDTSKAEKLPLKHLVSSDHIQSHRAEELDWQQEIDRSLWYVCPTTTPLYYAPVYRDLDHEHQLRYNQLTAVLFNELIAFFESEFASSVCVALSTEMDTTSDSQLAECLRGFVSEEQQHIGWWRKLSRLSHPEDYSDSQEMILRIPKVVRSFLRQLTHNPTWFPVVFWVMLALEERSLDISKRCLRMKSNEIEPHYLAVYRDHLKDETRHVHIDWHLIERHYAQCSIPVRKLNAWLLIRMISKFFLPPNRSAIRVVRRLVQERVELKPLLPAIEKQLRSLGKDTAYQEMMYSRESTPITFKLLDRFPEMQNMRKVLHTYVPAQVVA